ncbi:IS110 family transposase [Escherichia coli]|nr:IS110 family transposase [Escherichia coli]HAN4075438.1 IS110 family transposase [Escherichia coli]
MKSLTTETALDILIAWLQDNIDCESGIIFDNNEDKTDSAALLPCIEQAREDTHYFYLVEQIAELESELSQSINADDTAQRIMTIPGVGPITASLLSSQLGDGKQFSCSRDFAASTGLVPRQYSTGGKSTLLGISKRGDKNLRRLLVQCARSFIMRLERKHGKLAEWVREQLNKKHSNVVTCALANKLARIAWAITTQKKEYQA